MLHAKYLSSMIYGFREDIFLRLPYAFLSGKHVTFLTGPTLTKEAEFEQSLQSFFWQRYVPNILALGLVALEENGC